MASFSYPFLLAYRCTLLDFASSPDSEYSHNKTTTTRQKHEDRGKGEANDTTISDQLYHESLDTPISIAAERGSTRNSSELKADEQEPLVEGESSINRMHVALESAYCGWTTVKM